MQKQMMLIGAAALVLLSGCEKAEAPAPAEPTVEAPVTTAPKSDTSDPTAATHRHAGWVGKWTGVEGMYVTIAATGPGKYSLDMQSDLDTKGSYLGSDSERGIVFARGDQTETLSAATGDETGLKYLAGKKDCLKVKDGEGYCRD